MSDATLTIPGLIFVGAEGAGKDTAVVHLGPAVGWTIPRGVHTWSRELSVVMKEDVTPALQRELGVILPENQGDADLVPRARRAAQACKIVAVEEPVSDKLLAKGLRVHTVGFDRVSNGFFYFASGAGGQPRRVQGELIEIIAPSLDSGSREDLEARLDGLIDRLIAELSEGALSETQLELAEALPALGPKSDPAGAKLQTLEGWLILAATRSTKFEAEARRLAETLRGATRREADVVRVPLFGEARRLVQPELEVEVAEGEAGKKSRLRLPARTRWFVTGGLTPSTRPPPSKPAGATVPVARAEPAVDGARAAGDRVVADKAAAAAKAASEKAAADRAAADRAAAQRAAEKAAAEKAAASRAAADRVAAERASAERASAERAAAERAAAERVAAERVAAERAAAERMAAERAAAEHAAAERAAAERTAAERAAAAQAAAERAAAKPAAAQQVAVVESSRSSRTSQQRKKESLSIGFILVMLIVGAAVGTVFSYVLR